MSSFQSFNPFASSNETLRSAVMGDLNTPLGASRSFGSTTRGIASRSGSAQSNLPPGGSFTAGGQGLSTYSAGSRYKAPAYLAPGGARYQGVGDGSLLGRGGSLLNRGQGGLIEQGASILGEEMGLLQQAADRQFIRNQEPIEGMRDVIGRAGEITSVGNQTADELTGLGTSQAQAFEQGASDTMSQFDSTFTGDMTAAISGIRESYQPQMQAIRNGMNPDGTLMTPAQQKDALFAMNQQVGSQVQQTYTSLSSAYNQARAQLSQGFSAQRLNSQQLVGALAQSAAAIRNAAQASALQFEASGNQVMADMIYRNPESIVSKFQGFLALASMASAPGAKNLPAIEGL